MRRLGKAWSGVTPGLLVAGMALSCAPAGAPEARQPAPAAAIALTGDYLGQEPPGAEPRLFAPGIVSTGLAERDVAMTPDGDEFYFTATAGSRFGHTAVVVVRRVDGRWTEPEVASFSGRYLDMEPALSADGSRLYFMSKRPTVGGDPAAANEDIWTVERQADGWGEPVSLGAPVNTDAAEFFPSVTRDGTIYFTRRGDDRQESIYRSRWLDGAYQETEMLGPEVNSAPSQFNAFIAPDESYLIVCNYGREDSLGGIDYYVVFRSPDDRWSAPVNMGDTVNTAEGQEWSPYVSPDGRYLFFMSSRTPEVAGSEPAELSYAALARWHDEPMNGNSDIWWVDAGFIEELRPAGF